MEYINAKDILPETLIFQIQQYVGGSMIYIPQKDNDKRLGGASTCRFTLSIIPLFANSFNLKYKEFANLIIP